MPAPCSNTIRDGNETDVDCGGNVCTKCLDGKACIANTDCSGGTCLNKVCATVSCTNKTTDGKESDTDCGGSVCANCTIGKRCKADGDGDQPSSNCRVRGGSYKANDNPVTMACNGMRAEQRVSPEPTGDGRTRSPT